MASLHTMSSADHLLTDTNIISAKEETDSEELVVDGIVNSEDSVLHLRLEIAAYGLQSQWTHNYTRREGRGRSTQLVDLPRPAQPMLRHCDWPDENYPLNCS